MADAGRPGDRDEQRLAELGYKQGLNRGWSRFGNFAISFSIISVLAGCFALYGQAWQFGGPIAISWGWPILSLLILTVAFSICERVQGHCGPAGSGCGAVMVGLRGGS